MEPYTENEDRDYSLEKIDAILMEMRLKIDWIDTGKASKYKELRLTYKEISALATQIVIIAENESKNG